ncbi:hypothetical protein [Amycolatopsis sp. CA-230715]|uniref:hypothetical protein n=1 Tax=Amycolatopsis sp. CA-230715 TaxID=2745196 RepID=UPI001C031577|nr:hypothetical protein [Amycolatopsis sp. CA-230715]QWF78434.1 hypothetical protein HUW46_01830 [Amycolatopsis sp. CA-230715]
MSTSRIHGGRGTAARVVTGIGALFALIEVVYILMVVLGANQANAFFGFIRSIADPLALFFPGLFTLSDNDIGVVINYGLAAVFWLVVTGIVARVLR